MDHTLSVALFAVVIPACTFAIRARRTEGTIRAAPKPATKWFRPHLLSSQCSNVARWARRLREMGPRLGISRARILDFFKKEWNLLFWKE